MKISELRSRALTFIRVYHTPLAVGLAVVFVFAGVWFSAVRTNQKIIDTMDNLVQLTENIRRNYKNRPDYWGLSTDSVVQKQIAPAAMLQNGKLVCPVSSDVSVGSDETGSMVMPGMRSFYIAFKNLSKKDCVDLAVFPLSEKNKLGLLSVTIKSGDEETLFQWGGEASLPITKEQAAKKCRNKNIILWNFE